MLKKIQHSFWWGFCIATALSFVYFYIVWPRPVENLPVDEIKVVLPKPSDKAGISYPYDGEKVNGTFLIYGSGSAFENQGTIEIVNVNDQVLLTSPVYFMTNEMGQNGPFAVLVNLNQVKVLPENGKVNLIIMSPKDGKKTILDSKNVRFK